MNEAGQLSWSELSRDMRDALTGKLEGLWGAVSDEAAFNACSVDKQQALLTMATRLREKDLWQLIRKIDNVYGVGGVGIAFSAWPYIESTLKRRKDFTRLFAKHSDTNSGFYEKGRAAAVLHFLHIESEPGKWYLHFDLYSPVYSPASAFRHLRHEFTGKLTPDWKMIQKALGTEFASRRGV